MAHTSTEKETRPLEVLIVGAGLGGLTTAISLRRAGHNVKVFERSRLAHEYGAAINVPPNAAGVLKRLGIDPADAGAVEMKWFTEYDKTGQSAQSFDFTQKSKTWQHKYLLAHRVDLHTQLKNAAISRDGEGVPVELITGAQVIDIDPEEGRVTLESGSVHEGDLVVAADGIHVSAVNKERLTRADDLVLLPNKSTIRAKLTDKQPFHSGKSAYRFVLDRADVRKQPQVAELAEKDGELTFWFSTDRRIVMYPTRNNELLNFVCFYPDDHASDSVDNHESWNHAGSMEGLLKAYESFDPRVRVLLAMADPSSLKVWTLTDMEPVDPWHRGRLCLVGDAAHPFLPHQGQGGAQAIEDGVALGVLFSEGTEASEVSERLRLYQICREERAERVQEATRQSGKDLSPEGINDGERANKVMSFMDYNCGHDEHDHATGLLRDWMYKERSKARWRMPLSFGISPGPRQDLKGRAFESGHSTSVTRTIKFKTSRTLLQNLLPTEQFSFVALDTYAYASYVVTTLNRMDWLGGGGYDLWALYLHGVQYTKKDGSTLRGDFLALMVENLTDPILTGREELGFPKLFSDIQCEEVAQGWKMKSSWRQAEYLKLALHGLRDAPEPSPAVDDGTLAYKYVPATGRPGIADVEYAVYSPPQSGRTVERYQIAEHGSIEVDVLDVRTLPTLHHVANRLAELPVYEIVMGSVVEGVGVDDLSSVYRVE